MKYLSLVITTLAGIAVLPADRAMASSAGSPATATESGALGGGQVVSKAASKALPKGAGQQQNLASPTVNMTIEELMEEIDVDVLVGLQRCRGPTVDKEQISNLLQD
eukprot:s615_g14.t1